MMNIKPPLLCCACTVLAVSPALAGSGERSYSSSSRRVESTTNVYGVAEREAARRQDNIERAREAEGYYQTGRYNEAFRSSEKVLNIDPYNIAARKLEEKVNLGRDNYAVQAYNETRSRAIWEVDNAWQRPVKRFGAAAQANVY